MKKLLFSVAILAVAASCSKSEVTDVAPSTQNAIGFSTLNDRVTKVANTNAADTIGTATSSSYTVYSALSSAPTAWYIDNATVTSANSADGVYYWPTETTNTLSFYAFAPDVTDTNVALTATAATDLDIVFTVPADAGTDFTIATPVTGAYCTTGSYNSTTNTASGEVALTFSHMLSKATINVELSDALDDEYEMVFTNVQLTVDNNTVTADAVTGPTGTSSLMSGASAGTAGTDEPTYTYTITESSSYTTSVTGKQELMFAPQTSSTNSKIVVTGLTVRNAATQYALATNATATYTIDSLQAFAAGTSYAFNITLGVEDIDGASIITITFDASEKTWTSGTSVTIE